MKKILVIKSQKEIIKNLFKSNLSYVYIHYNLQTNKPIYVGQGTKYRLLESKARNKKWLELFKTTSIGVKVIKYNLTNQQAFELEAKLIKEIGLVNLFNHIDGNISIGDGTKLFREANGNYGNKGINNPLSIPIVCLTLEGVFVKKYNSIEETNNDGFSSTIVSLCCSGQRAQHKDRQFLYYKDYNKNKEYKYQRGKTSIRKVGKYSKDLKLIKTYNSINSTKEDGFNPKNVQQVCAGNKNTHFGYIFKYII